MKMERMKMTNPMRSSNGMTESPQEICPQCTVAYIDRENMDAIQNIGMCLGCDHLRTDPNSV